MSGPGTARTQDGDVNNSPDASEAPVVDGATASADHPSASKARANHHRGAPAPTAASTGPTIKVERSPSDEASVEDEEMEGGEDDSAADRNSKKGRSGAKGDDRDDALLSPKKQRAQKRKYRHKVGEKTRRDQTNRLYHQLEKNLYRANPSLQQTRRSRVVLLEMASEAIDRLLAETERLRHDLEVATNQPQKRQKFVSDVAISSPSSTTYSLSSACPPVTQFDHPALVPSTSVSSFASFVASSSLPFPSPPLSDQSDAALHTLRQAMSSNSLNQYDPSFSASQSAVQLHHASLINPTHPQPQPTTILDPMSNSAYVSSAYPPGPNPSAPSYPGSSPTPSQKRGFEQTLPSSLNKPTVPPQAYDIFNARVEQSGQFNYSARSFVPADSTARSGPRQSQAQNASPEERGAVASLMSKDLSHADARELERFLQQQWAPPAGGAPQPQQTAVSAQTQAMGGVQSTPPRGPNPYSLVTSANFSAQLTAGAARNVMPPSPAPSSMFSTGHSSGAGPSPGPIPKFDGSYQQVMFRCHLNQSGSIISGNDGGIQFLASLLLQTVDPSISSADASSVLRTNLHHNILAIVSPEEMRRVFEALSAIGNGSCYSICLPNIQLACPRATWAALLPRPRIGGVVVPENITARMNMVVCARITQEGVFEGYECAFTFTE